MYKQIRETILQLTLTQDPVLENTHRRRTQQESWQELREKTKTKEVSSNVIDERCQIQWSLREHSDHALKQTRLTKDVSTVEDLQQYFF